MLETRVQCVARCFSVTGNPAGGGIELVPSQARRHRVDLAELRGGLHDASLRINCQRDA